MARRCRYWMPAFVVALLIAGGSALGASGLQLPLAPLPGSDPLHQPLDEILDLYVRDGLVYYHALQLDRAKLDRYVASLSSPAIASAYAAWPRAQQMAFWINAYNAFVLRTVIGNYPIRGRAPGYPPDSIRQISGAFDQVRHQAAGRSLTLDQIETEMLAAFSDPRVFLVLGRGAVGSGRLRSEAFGSGRLEGQLSQAASESATTPRMVHIDRLAGQISVSSIFGWREQAFVVAYADKAPDLPGRTPIERAIVGFVQPHLLPTEREFLAKNSFQLKYQDFDWHLNDLTGSATR